MNQPDSVRDAAIVLRSLSQKSMSDVLDRLDDDCQQQLNACLDTLNQVSGDEFHEATRRFRKQVYGREDVALPSSSDALLWHHSGHPLEDPFGFVKYLDSAIRRELLEKEHPANVALVLISLPAAIASSIMSELDPQLRISVLRRLCEIEDIDDAKLIELRFELRMRAKKMMAIANCTRRGITVAAELLSLSDQRTRDAVLAWLADRDGELGQELERRVFSMTDLLEFSDDEIRLLLRQVDTSAWAGALRSTVPSVAAKVLNCLAPQAAEIVSQEMADFDPLDDKAMQWAVEQVVGQAMKLRQQTS